MFSLPARSGGSSSVISSYLAHIFLLLFLSQKLHRGFIIFSSGNQQGITQTLWTGSFFTGCSLSYPAGSIAKKTQKTCGLVIDSRRRRVPALERRRVPVLFMFALCRREESMRLCTLASFCLSTQSALPVKANPLFFFAPSRPQFSTSQYNHLRRAQHRHAHRQRLHRHSASAQRTPRRGDRVHQRPAALLHSEPHGCRHPPASLHRSTAIHRCDTDKPRAAFLRFHSQS